MSIQMRMWLQLVAAACFAVVALMELTGWKQPAFESRFSPWVLAAACLAMLYEAWRSWRKMKMETNES